MSNIRARLRTPLLVLFSVWIVYHIVVISVIPNQSNFLNRYFEKAIVPYASQLGMNASWNFFSPDPAHTMY
ncbi:MAG: hypothetical protein N2578_02655, partial [Bdellovibrionaceae bacterium]|nr:hypothetical protein [Pseudobdellovibrionaceae bacterium]